MEEHFFSCQCSDFRHVFRFVLDEKDGDLWLEVQLNAWEPWYKRAWNALKYVFGQKVAYGYYDTTMVKPEEFDRLRALLDKAEAAHRRAYEKPVLKG